MPPRAGEEVTAKNEPSLTKTRCEATWVVPSGNKEVEQAIARACECSPILARLLWNRGVRDADEAQRFLACRLNDLTPPDAFRAMPQAVARIREALRNQEKIAIFGDYDVDGISGTAILLLFLRRVEAQVRPFLPHRVNEGYGLSRESIERMHQWGAQLVVTVDNGSGCVEEINHGRSLGMDFVVTDHHEVAGTVPAGVPILNPKLPGETYPYRSLAGAGVAFKLVWALARELTGRTKVSEKFRQFLLEALALASLGTVADVVPLTGENRILTRHGLRMLGELKTPGLTALKDLTCDNVAVLKSHHIAFRIGPRLNAAGRLGEADRALELLITEDESRARELANELGKENDRRRRIEQKILRQARNAAAAEVDRLDSCLVLAHEDWHIGVVGIAAARLAEETERPVVLIALDGNEGRGSGRSFGGAPLHEALEACGHLMEDFGGHAEACGVRVRREQIPLLATELNEAVRSLRPAERPPFRADMVLPPHLITGAVLEEIERLAPFGQANDPPVFIAEGLPVVGKPRRMGKTASHLNFMCRSGPYTFRSVFFGGASQAAQATTPVSFAYEPFINSYMGSQDIELRVKKMF